MKSKGLLIAASLTLLTLSANLAEAQFGTISGRWTGHWENSNGSSGYDRLDVTEYPNGEISGVWGKGYRIFGQRRGPNVYYWEAESEGSLYRAEARLAGGGRSLVVNYSVLSYKNGYPREYRGFSELRRAGY